MQKNDGGTLGQNLASGAAGVADTGPYPAKDYLFKEIANDSHRGRKSLLKLAAYKEAKAGDFPYIVAAHHLIPGNAALNKVKPLIEFMKDGGGVESVAGKKYSIKGHIGYDVNGSHNGVWLPGNYAIKTALPERKKDGKTLPARIGTTPIPSVPWSALSEDHEEWQFDYVAGACKAGRGQFHDSHAMPYSASVRKYLGKLTVALALHLDNCELCAGKTEIPPPYRMKRRLYGMSMRLRGFVTGTPDGWRNPWFTSERWSAKFYAGGKLTVTFRRKYAEAIETSPHTIPF
jgi:hypothetical protein